MLVQFRLRYTKYDIRGVRLNTYPDSNRYMYIQFHMRRSWDAQCEGFVVDISISTTRTLMSMQVLKVRFFEYRICQVAVLKSFVKRAQHLAVKGLKLTSV